MRDFRKCTGKMRFSGLVRMEKRCCTTKETRTSPKTTQSAMDAPPVQEKVDPAKGDDDDAQDKRSADEHGAQPVNLSELLRKGEVLSGSWFGIRNR